MVKRKTYEQRSEAVSKMCSMINLFCTCHQKILEKCPRRNPFFTKVAGNSSAATAQKTKFSTEDFFCKCDQIRRKLRIWSYLRKKSLTENFIFCAVSANENDRFHSCFSRFLKWRTAQMQSRFLQNN